MVSRGHYFFTVYLHGIDFIISLILVTDLSDGLLAFAKPMKQS